MSADGVVVSVRIPHGAEPGDLLSLEVNGQNFTIEVPVASVMGEILEIKLAGCADEEDIAVDGSGVGVEKNVDPEKINFTMVTGSSIRIFQDSQTKTSEKTVSDGTFRLLWPASRFVVNYINTPDFRRDILSSQVHSALELGAGHGLLGLAFSDVASSVSSANETMKLKLTDVEEALPQLERNIRINRDVFEKRVDIAASPLKWHIQPRPRTNSNYDFILGSDLLYNTSVIPDLVATIRQLKFKRILFSVRWRKPSEERRFFELLSDIVDWELVHGNCQLDYRSYGNGSYESDKYFSQCMVSINGKMIPLSSVDDNSCEQMNTKEFEQYEEFQTQIYLGEIRDKRSTDHVKKRPKLEA